jgi:transcriptional regulator with GAF, ATPase, and Fis domain
VRKGIPDPATLRSKYWLLGASVALPVGLTNFFVNYGVAILPLGSVGSLWVLAAFTYAASRHQLIDPTILVLKAGAAVLALLPFLLPVGGAFIAAQTLPIGLGVSVIVGAIIATVSVVFVWIPAVRIQIEHRVERSFFPSRHAARQSLRKISNSLTKLPRDPDLARQLLQALISTIGVTRAAIYQLSEKPRQFLLWVTMKNDRPTMTIRLSPHVSIENGQLLRGQSGWETIVPVANDDSPAAIIALGPKTSGAAIDDSDRTLLSMVAGQLAVALKNAEYVNKIERQKEQIEQLLKRVEAENVVLREEVRTHSQFTEIIGSSNTLRTTLDYVAKVAPTDASILITGETGTGKELIARAIHEISPRSDGPLISVNCPAIPIDLAESELFGHERGAFTGAHEAHPGKFEMAHRGTIFLDEVADLPATVQVKLLRVLQEREVQRLGSHKVRSIDVRIVSATNRDLQEEIRKGRFREDLYFRLASVPVHLPPLRDRIGDVTELASFFLSRATTLYQKTIKAISPEALQALTSYSWPGNIRELQHVIERAVLLCNSGVLRPEHLSDLAASAIRPVPPSLGAAIREEKLRRVREALFQSGGNQAAAARLLGMSRSNLARLIKRHGIDPGEFTQ